MKTPIRPLRAAILTGLFNTAITMPATLIAAPCAPCSPRAGQSNPCGPRTPPVCGNTWRMLHDTRFHSHFDFFGDFSHHYGLFAGCGGSMPFDFTTTTGGCC